MQIDWPKGTESSFFKREARLYDKKILKGGMLCIDPAVHSLGWAYFYAGELVESGYFKTKPASATINNRLGQVYDFVWSFDDVDVLVIEKLIGARIHRHLQNACGVVKAAQPDAAMIECPIRDWKACTKLWEGYSKTDENDAIMLGVATLAKIDQEVKIG